MSLLFLSAHKTETLKIISHQNEHLDCSFRTGIPHWNTWNWDLGHFIMASLWNRAGRYIFCSVVSSISIYLSFFHRHWMSTILPHMMWP